MTYFPHDQKEPSGCVQTIIVTRAIIGIVLVPTLLIIGAIIGILVAFYALTISPLLGLAVVLLGAGIIFFAARWESRRALRDFPADDE